MSLGERIYEAVARAAAPTLRLASPLSAKLAAGLQGRRSSLATLESWARTGVRRESGPIIWLHAPSVGEALMAQAILGALRLQRPELRFAFTFFSPSAERVAQRIGADVAAYLPWDTAEDMGRALAILDPVALVFVRTEIWPVLVRMAVGQGKPTLLVNAVLASRSSRLRAPARTLLRTAYNRLDAVGAVAQEDADRFPRLGVPAGRVSVTGDARFDQVGARVAALDRDGPLLHALRMENGFTIVAGSTWPQDEERLTAAFAKLRATGSARLVIAPHEPTTEHLGTLEKRLAAAGLAHTRLGAIEAGAASADVIVIDRVGVLADLYALADVAWVGGGFGRAGLHSVAEPAALGVPVLFGPRHGSAREGAELVAEGGGFLVSDADSALQRLSALRTDLEARTAAGRAAGSFVERRLGGAARNAALIAEHL
jgi:3-deoxy-D-manno-octulosonic-acid transferase